MYSRLEALKLRSLAVLVMFLASACVIQRAADQKTEEPAGPTPAAKAEATKNDAPQAEQVKNSPKLAEPKAKAPAATKPAPKVAKAPVAAPAQAKTETVKTNGTQAKPEAPAATPAKAEVALTRVMRYVKVDNLNVRSRANAHAPIVGRLARGSMVTVSVEGGWAKIGDQQFIAVKHLSKTQPAGKRLVSRK